MSERPTCSFCTALSPSRARGGCKPVTGADLSRAQSGDLAPGGGEIPAWPVDAALLVPEHLHHGLYLELALTCACSQQLSATSPPDWSAVRMKASYWSAPGVWASEGALGPAPHDLAPAKECHPIPPAPGPGCLQQPLTAQVYLGGHTAHSAPGQIIPCHQPHLRQLEMFLTPLVTLSATQKVSAVSRTQASALSAIRKEL